jgi:hypothetical protein
LRQCAPKNQSPHTGFVDDRMPLRTAKGVPFGYTSVVRVDVIGNSFA